MNTSNISTPSIVSKMEIKAEGKDMTRDKELIWYDSWNTVISRRKVRSQSSFLYPC